ncbi:hypothetical protein [Lysobacter sp. Hz 25]|uniref:hypothetical protein n=1 Tax=Lysobacter sp. Hz 25 TaxID=3383698 RepID=UPI0038D4DF16
MRAVLALLLLFGLAWCGAASAATQCPNNPYRCSQPEAYNDADRQAREAGNALCVAPGSAGLQRTEVHSHTPSSGGTGSYSSRFMCKKADGSPGQAWDYRNIAFAFYKNDCTSRPSVTETNHPNNALQCNKGCVHRFFIKAPNANGIVFSEGIATGETCNPDNYTCPQGYRPGGAAPGWLTSRDCIPIIPDKCPEGQTLVNGICKREEACPSGMKQDDKGTCVPEKNECPAGQIKGPDGSCVDDGKCPAGQARGKDGSCKKDDDGDGKPNADEDDGKFSGGNTCDEPPQCSGDNILCGQARIQWRIDCNTRKNYNISGGGCNAVPICTGDKCDALEYAQLLQQWRSTCALEKLAQNSGTGGGEGQPAWTKADGMNQDPGAGSSAGDTDIWAPNEVVDGSGLNSSGFIGGAGACPGFPSTGGGTLSSGFFAMMASPPPMWCSFITWCALIINVFALVSSIYILARP